MKKKSTRKVRKNKRTTQRRNNRSNRLRGGAAMMFSQRKQIMKLLKNLIINNLEDDFIKELCANQQTTRTPMATEKQPLLSQPELLDNREQVDDFIKKLYDSFINTQNGKFQYSARLSKPDVQEQIITALKAKNITFFDGINPNSVHDILSPYEFSRQLGGIKLGGIMISEVLVYSMFALCVNLFTLLPIVSRKSIVYNVDPIKCPPTSTSDA